MQRQLTGDLVLVFVTLCWGITFPLIENAVQQVNPAVFVAVRFILGALLLLPFVWRFFKMPHLGEVVKAGVVLGLMNAVVYLAQTIGMETISAAEGAFITGATVIIVPFLLPVFKLGKIIRTDVIFALICLFGLFLLTGASFSHVSRGELWVLLCAFFNAAAIVYLQKVSMRLKNLSVLAFMQIGFTGVFASFFTIGKPYADILAPQALIGLLFCAIFASSLALLLQTKYQHYTTANRAAMIFCLEPLFGGLFGYLINGETLGWISFCGGALIVVSIVSAELYRVYGQKNNNAVDASSAIEA